MVCANCGHERSHHIKVYSSERCWYSYDENDEDDDKMCDCREFEEKQVENANYVMKKNCNP